MSGSLERRDPTHSAVGGPAAPVATGRASKLDDFSFTTALTWEKDIPQQFRRGALEGARLAITSGKGGELVLASSAPKFIAPRSAAESKTVEATTVASGVRELPKLRRSAGRVVQRRIGWQATPDRIVLTTAEREMVAREPGKYAPAGPWLIEDRRTFNTAPGAKAARRTGNVPVDRRAAAPQGQPSATEPSTEQAREEQIASSHPEGASAMGFLPAPVRQSMIGRVPNPTHFDGTILQWADTSSGEPTSLQVNVLRMDKYRAVVIQAKRSWHGEVWEVSQADYQLTDVQIEAG